MKIAFFASTYLGMSVVHVCLALYTYMSRLWSDRSTWFPVQELGPNQPGEQAAGVHDGCQG